MCTSFCFRKRPRLSCESKAGGPIRSGREQSEFNDLQHEISSIILSSNQNSWRWSLNPSGEFSVSALRAIIDSKLLGQTGTKLCWNNLVPSKINILAWRIRNYRLPTRANLDKRGIDLHSILCPLCEEKIEDEDHLFALCTFSRNIWDLIRKWWGLDAIPLDGALNVLDLADDGDLNLGERTSSFFDVVVLCAIGWIWRARNLLVFHAVKSFYLISLFCSFIFKIFYLCLCLLKFQSRRQGLDNRGRLVGDEGRGAHESRDTVPIFNARFKGQLLIFHVYLFKSFYGAHSQSCTFTNTHLTLMV
ncbi:hypothetical protein CTI12_AA564980 [Artemisia annua]|uniref:Reverse transcriptase zinc-binding domain-containing protein n=1 Tax=Artemisia annua TaxID=35608 RepID=A0A2U1KTZ9_ARTAN|nr:hypothetical protein CTI12_AA564980 [Artemisia annua]